MTQIKKLRLERKLTLMQVAVLTGLSLPTISKIEKGNGYKEGTVQKLAKGYGLKVEQMRKILKNEN